MTKSKKTASDNNSKEDTQPTQSIEANAGLTDYRAGDDGGHTRQNTRHRITNKKYNQAQIANWIAGIAVCVSIVLAVFTYSLFKQASNQTVVANKSAAAANLL